MEKSVAEQILDSKNVCTDMISRLQSQVPRPITSPFPPQSPHISDEKLSVLEDNLKKLQQKIDSIMEPKKPNPEDAEKIMAENITKELQDVVDAFNKGLTDWIARTGCVVNFSWNYQQGGKQLEIAGIDYIVYRKEPPSAKTMKEIVNASAE